MTHSTPVESFGTAHPLSSDPSPNFFQKTNSSLARNAIVDQANSESDGTGETAQLIVNSMTGPLIPSPGHKLNVSATAGASTIFGASPNTATIAMGCPSEKNVFSGF